MSSIVIQGDTSGSITVEAPSVAGTHTLTLPKATGNIATDATVGLGQKNLIINGNMRIAQRGTSFTGVGGSSVQYTLDRWSVREATDAVVNVSQAVDSPSTDFFKYCLKLDVTTADTSIAAGQVCTVQHRMEAQDLVLAGFGTANAKQLTISFWHKHTKTGTYSVGFTNHNGTRSYPAEYTQNVSDTWEKSTVTFTADTTGTWATDNTLGMIVYFSVAAGTDFHATVDTWTGANDFASANQVNALDSTSNSFRLTGVQLEVGENATPFENRMYSTELAMCQRYYYKTNTTTSSDRYAFFYPARVTAATTATVCATYPTMRTSPSITQSGTGINIGPQGATTAFTGSWVTPSSAWIDVTVSGVSMTAGQCVMLNANNNANAYVAMDAEL